MNSKRILASAAAALALTAAILFATNANAESNGGVKVMPLGDSITDGFNVPGGYRIDLWQRFLANRLTVDFVGSGFNGPAGLGDHDHEGHSGWRIDQIDANIVNWLRTSTPRTILLHIGTNDMIQNPANAPARLATLLDHIIAQSPNAELFVATIIPLSGQDSAVRTFNAGLTSAVQTRANAGRRIHLVDMFNALTLADLADGVHPNANGYNKMSAVWFNALRSVPGALDPPANPSPSPSTSRPPSPAPSPSPSQPGQPGTCRPTYRVTNSWGTGFNAEVSVANAGSTVLNGWTVRMTLASGQTITNLWNGVNTGTSGPVSVRNAPYNGTIAVNASTAFGYTANGNGALTPTNITCTSP
jgi:lysophospholipase L1-like esterase